MELQLGSDDIRFFENRPNTLIEDVKDKIQGYYPNLLEHGYIPFADRSDHGVLCFDATESIDDHNYPIVSFDHEYGYEEPDYYALNFEFMFHEFNEYLNSWIANWRKSNKD